MLENTSWGVEASVLGLFICFYSKHHCQEHRRDGQGGLRQRAITHTRQSQWLPWDTICQQWLSQYIQKSRTSPGCMWQPPMPFPTRCLGRAPAYIHLAPSAGAWFSRVYPPGFPPAVPCGSSFFVKSNSRSLFGRTFLAPEVRSTSPSPALMPGLPCLESRSAGAHRYFIPNEVLKSLCASGLCPLMTQGVV